MMFVSVFFSLVTFDKAELLSQATLFHSTHYKHQVLLDYPSDSHFNTLSPSCMDY